MEKLQGDLLKIAHDGNFDIIVHGCNCFNTMGSGIARQIAEKYPEAKAADLATVKGDRKKLGNFTFASVKGDEDHTFTIVNAYTQFACSGYKDVFEYNHFSTFLNRLSSFSHTFAKDGGEVKIGFPMIGCGYARGDEKRIIPMIEGFSRDVKEWGKVTLVSYR